VGKVNQDLTVKVLKSTNMGGDIGACFFLPALWLVGKRWGLTDGTDYAMVNAVVDATHRYKEIFYTDK
jgi:replication factor A3